MKTIVSCIALVTANLVVVIAQSPQPGSVPPPAPPPPPPPLEEDVVVNVKRTASDAVRSAMKAAEVAVAEAGKFGRDVESALLFGRGARPSSRSLAILSTAADPGRVEMLEEDLSVMGRILQKAARSMRDDERFNAMGLDLETSVFGSASGARNLYLEGYGALFLLSVKYPLVAPPEAAETVETATDPDSEWERTREEVLGISRDSGEGAGGVFWKGGSRVVEKYDQEKVDGLITALLDALKNAVNIRSLALSESITVVVQGGRAQEGNVIRRGWSGKNGDTVDIETVRKEGRGKGGVVTIVKHPGDIGETVLTLRVKKADVDAIAGGKLDLEAFRRKAEIQTYVRRDMDATRPSRR